VFSLDSVVPWGRSFDEYRRMFAVTDADLTGRILGCGDGPASFNAEATQRGARVVSCDPIYRFDADAIRGRIAETRALVLEQTSRNAHEFVWASITSIDALERVRMQAMDLFLADYTQGRADGRYIDATLPALPFDDGAFDLALCSHLLFLYSAQFDEAFHEAAVAELCRVAREVRVFPLLALGGARSPHLEPVSRSCRATGHEVSIERVPYEFQRGANEMLRVRAARRPR
jgi:SAM-dependent methyltransferase